jgi:transcriptional regulator with XRE-family HTH domain
MKQSIFENEAFGEAVKAKRTKLKMGVRGLKDIGVSAATVSRIENGNLPDIITYMKLCAWLNKPMSAFVSKTK